MDRITGTYLPLSLSTEERNFVFSYYAMKSALFSNPATNEYPHFYTESEAVYSAPIFTDRIVPTPNHGMRLVLTISLPISPMYGFNANGIWNHVFPVAPNLVIPE